jgi:hypothetical protein
MMPARMQLQRARVAAGVWVVRVAALGGCASPTASTRPLPLLYAPALDGAAPPDLLPDEQKTAGGPPSVASAREAALA